MSKFTFQNFILYFSRLLIVLNLLILLISLTFLLKFDDKLDLLKFKIDYYTCQVCTIIFAIQIFISTLVLFEFGCKYVRFIELFKACLVCFRDFGLK